MPLQDSNRTLPASASDHHHAFLSDASSTSSTMVWTDELENSETTPLLISHKPKAKLKEFVDPTQFRQPRRNKKHGGRENYILEQDLSINLFFTKNDADLPLFSAHADTDRFSAGSNQSAYWDFLGVNPFTRILIHWTSSSWKRYFLFNVFPVLFVVLWASVPFPTVISSDDPLDVKFSFDFFLFFYFAIFNIVSLLFTSQIFHVYNMEWRPQSRAFIWNFTPLLMSMGVGYCMHLLDIRHKLAWTFLSLFVQLLPVFIAFIRIRREQKHVWRQSPLAMHIFHAEAEMNDEYRQPPASYRRFLYFCTLLALATAGKAIIFSFGYLFISTLPHTTLDGLIYVYSTHFLVLILDSIAEHIIITKINSKPLLTVFRLYFNLISFSFNRFLFLRLRSVQQFAIIQLSQSLGVMLLYPLQMTRQYHLFVSDYFWTDRTYEEHKKRVCWSFFLRNIAENSTMLLFLACLPCIHLGRNNLLYPLFQFNNPADPYTFNLTVFCSLAIFASELLTTLITRRNLRVWFGVTDTKSLGEELTKSSPHVVSGLLAGIVQISMTMLVALVDLNKSV